MKTLRPDSLLSRSLTRLAELICARPKLFIYPQVALFVACVVYTVLFLQFDTNRDDLVGENKKYHKLFLEYKKEFPEQGDMVVIVESDKSEKNRQFVERLGAKLEAETNLFRGVFFKGDLPMMGSKALLFVPEDDLEALVDSLKTFAPFIHNFTATTNLVSFFDTINTRIRTASRDTNGPTASLVKAFPVLERIVRQATACLARPGTPPSPGVAALFDAGDQPGQQAYITFADGRLYLVTARAPSDALNSAAVVRMRQLVEETRREITGVNAGMTGSAVLEYDEMQQAQKDMTRASIVSLVLCAIIFVYGYRETGRPIKATLCLVIGLGYTMAFTTLVVGHLNVLTITFVPMLIGLAIDFGVHLVTRYEEELRHGRSEQEALTTALVYTGQGILTGALTTAGAFFAMTLTQFKGIQEMGLICGGGLVICLVPMLTTLPALLLKGRQNVIDHEAAGKPEFRARIENMWLRRPVLVMALAAGLCAAALPGMLKLQFDYNLLNMQSKGLPAVEYEHLLINSTTKSVLFGVVLADSLEEAVEFESELQGVPSVSEVQSMSRYLAQNSAGKLEHITEVKKELDGIRFQPPDGHPVNLNELSRTLYSFNGYLGNALEEIGDKNPELTNQITTLRVSVEKLRKSMLAGNPQRLQSNGEKLGAFQRALFDDIRETFATLRDQDDTGGLQIADLPTALRDRFIGVTGKYLLQVYPVKDLWQRENQREFLDDVRNALDPERTGRPVITGTPLQLYEYTNLLKTSYEQAAVYALAAIAVLIFVHFRNLSSVLFALLPVFIGSL
ncbi:MAG TPA: MMPL family transporter, partial [Verrucomicrobiota bacterium]|nr:MMPL family transporter [Verrucomicrobiota bacterium]